MRDKKWTDVCMMGDEGGHGCALARSRRAKGKMGAGWVK